MSPEIKKKYLLRYPLSLNKVPPVMSPEIKKKVPPEIPPELKKYLLNLNEIK
jgi:hypothetical protein